MVEHILMRSYLIWSDTRVRRGQVDGQPRVAGVERVGVLISVAGARLPRVEVLLPVGGVVDPRLLVVGGGVEGRRIVAGGGGGEAWIQAKILSWK